MNNREFKLLTEEQRRQKLGVVLSEKTGGRLTGRETGRIIRSMPADRQHEIIVHISLENFCRELRDKGSREMSLLAERMEGDGGSREAAAVSLLVMGEKGPRTQLHVYVPPERNGKEMAFHG